MNNLHKNEKEPSGDDKMSKIIKKDETDQKEIRNIEEILNKGIKRYDKALEKLSKN